MNNTKTFTVSVKRKTGKVFKHYDCTELTLQYALETLIASSNIVKLTIELNSEGSK
mgnify:CR=1 FL=1